MISKDTIMGLAGLFKGKVSPQKVSEAYDFAQQVMATAKDPMDALRKGNVTPEFIDKVKPLLSLPIIGDKIRSLIGLDNNTTINVLDQLKSGLSNGSSAAQAPADDLSVFRNALTRVRK